MLTRSSKSVLLRQIAKDVPNRRDNGKAEEGRRFIRLKKQYGRRVSIDELRLLAKQQKPSTLD